MDESEKPTPLKKVRPQVRKRKRTPNLNDLQMEIVLLKEWILRTDDLAQDEERLPEVLKILDKLGEACVHLSTMLKTQRSLSDSGEAVSDLNKVFEDVLENRRAFFEAEKRSGFPSRDPGRRE